MLTIEKVLLLKAAGIFAGVPEEMLVALADALAERSFPHGALVFAEGETGECLYIVAAGGVRIERGEPPRLLARLGRGQVFGELAVLDPEPRSASARADADPDETGAQHGDVLLFEIGSETLYELLADHVEVVRGIITVLCRRLRDAGKK